MKNSTSKLVVAAVLGAASTGWAALSFTGGGGSFSVSSTGAQNLPDNAPGVGNSIDFNFSGYTHITDISVTFTLASKSGDTMWNGDIYAYLSHNSQIAVLLNHVGATAGSPAGYGTVGFTSITLGSAGSGDIHFTEFPLQSHGAYEADGRLAYGDTDRNNTLSLFTDSGGADPNGTWTLYFEDGALFNEATLSGWTINMSAVPEPTTWALIVFGTLFGTVQGARFYRRREAAASGD